MDTVFAHDKDRHHHTFVSTQQERTQCWCEVFTAAHPIKCQDTDYFVDRGTSWYLVSSGRSVLCLFVFGRLVGPLSCLFPVHPHSCLSPLPLSWRRTRRGEERRGEIMRSCWTLPKLSKSRWSNGGRTDARSRGLWSYGNISRSSIRSSPARIFPICFNLAGTQ